MRDEETLTRLVDFDYDGSVFTIAHYSKVHQSNTVVRIGYREMTPDLAEAIKAAVAANDMTPQPAGRYIVWMGEPDGRQGVIR